MYTSNDPMTYCEGDTRRSLGSNAKVADVMGLVQVLQANFTLLLMYLFLLGITSIYKVFVVVGKVYLIGIRYWNSQRCQK